MTFFVHSAKRLSFVLFLTGLFTATFAPRADAQQLSVTAVNATVSIKDGTAQATFSIKVVNSEQSPLTNFVVTFKDGSTASIGDVPATGAATSQPETKFIDVSQSSSASIPLPVTLTYGLDGKSVEISWAIVLARP